MSHDIQPVLTVVQVRTCSIKSLVQRGLAAGEGRTTTWTGKGCLMQLVMFIRSLRLVVSYNSFTYNKYRGYLDESTEHIMLCNCYELEGVESVDVFLLVNMS